MSYVGNTNTTQAFTPAVDYFSGNGSTVAFTLSRPVASTAQVQAVVNNVPQNPTDAFTVLNNTITFTSAPSSGTNNIYVQYTSPITQVAALPQSPQVFGNLQFSGTGQRITGDFSNATRSNRLMFQTSTTNASTAVQIIPNGTATQANFEAWNNGSDLTNGNTASLISNSTEVSFRSNTWGSASALPMTFYTGGSERVRIDTSGRVAMPYQPAFFAYPSGNISGTGQAVFGLTRFNRGSNYSTSTGRFTAPVAGVYFFTAQGLPLSTVNYPFMRIWKNGSGYSADTYVVNADESVSISCAVEMAANDYVTVYYIDGSEGGYSHFSGFFIG